MRASSGRESNHKCHSEAGRPRLRALKCDEQDSARERTGLGYERTDREEGSERQESTNRAGLPLADDVLLIVAERHEPALAGQGAHLANVIDIDQGVAVNAPETGIAQFVLQHFKG